MVPPSRREPAAHGRPEAADRGTVPGGPPPSVTERTGPLRVMPRPGERGGPADRAPSTPDRVAAWHGSPEGEPWPEPKPAPRPAPRPQARPEPAADPRLGPRVNHRPEPWADPRPEPRADRWSEPWPEGWPAVEPWPADDPWAETGPSAAMPGRRAGRRDRVPQSVFAELLSLAAIPHAAYAVDEEVPGAMCLVKADGGFEVFSRTDDARLDVRFFEDEEAAYFYLFGVLAAEAVRSGRLRSAAPNGHVNGSRGALPGPGPGVPSPAGENVSKYLRSEKLPKSAPRPVIVN